MTDVAVRRRAAGKSAGTGVIRDLISGRAPLASLSGATTIERVEMVKAGLPASFLVFIAHRMSIPKERLYATIGVSRATVDRKVRAKKLLSQDESERALGLARLVAQVETIVKESGNPEGFDAARWLAGWLEEPQPSLGGKRPADLMDTADGRGLVADLVARSQTGAYA